MGGIIKHRNPNGNPPFETFFLIFHSCRVSVTKTRKVRFHFFQELHFSVDLVDFEDIEIFVGCFIIINLTLFNLEKLKMHLQSFGYRNMKIPK